MDQSDSHFKSSYHSHLYQFHSQQFPEPLVPLTSSTDFCNNNSEEPLTRHDLQRLKKIVDMIFSNKSIDSSEFSAQKLFSTEDKILSSIISHLPLNVNQPSEIKQIMPPLNTLNIMLNHTYPNLLSKLIDNNSEFLNQQNTMNSSSINNKIPSNTPLCIPSKELCKQLINDYFTRFNVIIPIINRQKFNNQQNYHYKTISEMLMCSILAVAAARYSDDPSIQKTPDKPGGIFFDSAKKLLDKKYNTPSLETIQTLLLLVHAETSMTRIHSQLMFFGMAAQMAHSLHLERNDTSLSDDENEERRRIFYCVYCSESMLKQIRSELTKWLRELSDDLRFQSLSNADSSSNNLSNFSVFTGYINILFHTCILLLHQPYLTRTSGPNIEVQKHDPDGPIKICLTAVNTITEIARTTQNFDDKAFCSFHFPIYGLLQSTMLELIIMNDSQEFDSI
ncbi:11288_t:CDS:2, partial [Scutellospora calospora]